MKSLCRCKGKKVIFSCQKTFEAMNALKSSRLDKCLILKNPFDLANVQKSPLKNFKFGNSSSRIGLTRFMHYQFLSIL